MNLLYIEWLKIRHYRTFWVMTILFGSLLLLWNIAMNNGIITFGGGMNIFSNAYSFPEVWDNLGFWVKFFTGLLSIVIITLTTNEIQYRTNRQNVIDGWTRLEFFHAKWILLVAMSLAVTAFTALLGVAFGLINGSAFGAIGGHLERLGYVLLLTVNYFAFAFTLSIFIKRSGLSVVLFLLYVYIIEIILQQLINWKIPLKPGNLLPLQCTSELLPFPIIRTVKGMMKMSEGPGPLWLCVATLVWIAIYYIIGRRKLLRSDW